MVFVISNAPVSSGFSAPDDEQHEALVFGWILGGGQQHPVDLGFSFMFDVLGYTTIFNGDGDIAQCLYQLLVSQGIVHFLPVPFRFQDTSVSHDCQMP